MSESSQVTSAKHQTQRLEFEFLKKLGVSHHFQLHYPVLIFGEGALQIQP